MVPLVALPPRIAVLALCAALLMGGCRQKGGDEPIPHLGHVPAFTLTDQAGRPFAAAELQGKPHLVSFMFTRCPSVCPTVLGKKKAVLKAVQQAGLDLSMVSISIDGDNDTPEVLARYAEKHGLDLAHWTLLTGDAREVAAQAEQSFKIAVSGKADETQPHFGLTHGSHLVLVDAQGEIRGYYAAMDAETPQRIASDLTRL